MNKSTQLMPAAIPLYFVAAMIETVINCSPENNDLSLPRSDAVIWRAAPDIFKQQKLLAQRHSVTFQGIKYSATLLSEPQIFSNTAVRTTNIQQHCRQNHKSPTSFELNLFPPYRLIVILNSFISVVPLSVQLCLFPPYFPSP